MNINGLLPSFSGSLLPLSLPFVLVFIHIPLSTRHLIHF